MRKIRSLKYLPEEASYSEMDSPVGNLIIITSPAGLHAILWDIDRHNSSCAEIINGIKHSNIEKTFVKTKKQLIEYFDGQRKIFDLPLVIKGTPFQMHAWKTLLTIPYSNTISYAEQALQMGDKNKARAVGMANGQNPISIVVPCHRVVGSKGNLVGFGGGLDKKAFLLSLEKN